MSVVKRLKREYPDFRLDVKDWEILDRGITVLWGPSGAGKSSLLRVLLGLDPEAQLQWEFAGLDLGALRAEARGLGVVFQNLALFPHLTARQNILFPVDMKKHPHWEADFRWLVDHLQLSHRLDYPIHKLSGGERQRVALARSLIYRPRLLLLDEPFSSLDEELRQTSREMVRMVSAHLGCPVLLVTHDRADVEALAGRVCQMQHGRIVKVAKSLSP
jgi:sulfate transport system ATP-binding protein/putative spermidine/putrescine transport system ATP-binding protein